MSAKDLRTPGRPRCDVTRRAILDAAYELLVANGFAGFTIEGVALRSGAAKTTIYRWWPSKSVLAVEAFLEVAQLETAFPSTDSPLADLKAQIRLVARAFRGPSGRTLAGIIAAMQSDPETARAFIAGFVEPRRGAARQAVQRGIASGELRADLDLEATLDCLYGPLYHRLLVGHRGLDDGAVDALVDVVLGGVGAGAPAACREAADAA
jgi:AcrR family transcriptional regulator